MSNPTDDTEKQDDHLKYAPKWARDRHYNGSPSIAGDEFPPHNEQSFPAERPEHGSRSECLFSPMQALVETHSVLRLFGGRLARVSGLKIGNRRFPSGNFLTRSTRLFPNF